MKFGFSVRAGQGVVGARIGVDGLGVICESRTAGGYSAVRLRGSVSVFAAGRRAKFTRLLDIDAILCSRPIATIRFGIEHGCGPADGCAAGM
jgi:hypothetical protein